MSVKTQDILNACKRRPLLCVCIFAGLCLFITFYLRMDKLGASETALEERSKELKRLKTNVTNSAQLEQQIHSLKEVNQSISDNALREGDLARNQQVFLRLETETGVKLVDLRPVPPSPKGVSGSYFPMTFSLTISGEYRQILMFFKRLEQGQTFAHITNVALSGVETGPQTISLSVDLLGIRR